MTYIAWAVLYEGETDASYFDVLMPRIIEELAIAGPRLPTIPQTPAIRLRRAGAQAVAEEACAAAEAFHIVFIHADTGGRAQEQNLDLRGAAYCEAMKARCDWPTDRCVVVAPRHETEAWVLGDPQAVTDALGYNGAPQELGLPPNAAAAERLVDPKRVLWDAASAARGRRRSVHPIQIYSAIAQRQRLAALRASNSFQAFEASLSAALRALRLI